MMSDFLFIFNLLKISFLTTVKSYKFISILEYFFLKYEEGYELTLPPSPQEKITLKSILSDIYFHQIRIKKMLSL